MAMNDTATVAATSASLPPTTSPPISLAYAVASAELALHPVALCISGLNLVVLWGSRFLHPNLRFILICQSWAIVGFELQRLWVVPMKLLGNDIFFPAPIFLQVCQSKYLLFP
jgi:hypothetical protein